MSDETSTADGQQQREVIKRLRRRWKDELEHVRHQRKAAKSAHSYDIAYAKESYCKQVLDDLKKVADAV